MGKIIRFPILVIDDKATEEQYGITPQLRSEIRNIAYASREAVVSEHGIRAAIDELNFATFGENITTTGVGISGFPAFHNPNAGDVIGKFLIKCTEKFNDPTTQFSIGVHGIMNIMLKNLMCH